ncbi:hypothetical protein CEE45_10995 [Candidatus Heimdallarchaeota archaeon B3_Heim]|nr:MAG: hypothetical protein CEE45_10995 [Candidatus Heimdallarchaeota archaeon B3_Heim]
MVESIISPPDILIKQIHVKHRIGTPNYLIKGFGAGRIPIWRWRTKKAIRIEGGVDTLISGIKETIIVEPGPAMNHLIVLEGEYDEREYCIVRGAFRILA